MFVEERRQLILEQLERDGKILVKGLSERFKVTPDLIRKDLAALEKNGCLKRTYGGAVPLRRQGAPVGSRRVGNLSNPLIKRIAMRAESLIRDDEMVFLDVSSINIEVARLLAQKNRRVTVVTNMIEILNLLQTESQTSLIFLGGKLNRSRDGFTGAVTIEWMAKYHFDLALIGVAGVNIARNIVTTKEIDDALTKTCVLKVSKKSYLLAEATKFSQEGNCQSAWLTDFYGIITDSGIDEKTLKTLTDKKLDVQLV